MDNQRLHEEITHDWFQRYSAAVNTGYSAATGSPLESLRYSDLDRLCYFLRRCRPYTLSVWSVIYDDIGSPQVWVLEEAEKSFSILASCLRQKDFDAARSSLSRLRAPGIQPTLYNAVIAFSKGMNRLNAKVRKHAKKSWGKQRKSRKELAIKSVVSQATKSRLTTPEYSKTGVNPRPLPGSYGWRQ